MDQETFNKSYLEPAKSMFNKQIAPQIQQSFISSGQQRGTGMENALTRAGVEMDQLLNQQYAQMQQQAMQNKLGGISAILGQGPGVGEPPSKGTAMLQGLGGYLSSPQFGKGLEGLGTGIGSYFNKPQVQEQRKGFE